MNYSRETGFTFRERRKSGVHKWVRSFRFLGDGIGLRDSVFEPHEIKAMSTALDEVCEALKLHNDSSAKQVMAARIMTWCGAESAALLACVRGCFTRQAWLRRDRGEVGRLCSPRELTRTRHRVPNKSPACNLRG
jgi:hypothetical protein